jgi:hypothetical protein
MQDWIGYLILVEGPILSLHARQYWQKMHCSMPLPSSFKRRITQVVVL